SAANITFHFGNGDGTFQPAVHHGTNYGPLSITLGDFDEDGHQDLVVSFIDEASLSLLLGNGDGTFQAGVDHHLCDGPFSFSTEDFDGDGHQDLAVTYIHDSNGVHIALGNGDGSFRSVWDHSVSGYYPISMISEDLDGDGHYDLAVANQDPFSWMPGNVTIFQGNGDGTFRNAGCYVVGEATVSLATGDFDGNDRPDLVVANAYSNNISVLINVPWLCFIGTVMQ
ncbi:FG-GAP repeat domain-containing protein, partial [Thermodesulfobacteriota bacterium]